MNTALKHNNRPRTYIPAAIRKFLKLRNIAELNDQKVHLWNLDHFSRERNLHLAESAREMLKVTGLKIVYLEDEMGLSASYIYTKLNATSRWSVKFFDNFVTACTRIYPLLRD